MFFHGCWNEPGHFWWTRGGHHLDDRLAPSVFARWIDGGYAPRVWRAGYFNSRSLVKNPAVCFVMEVENEDDRRRIMYDATEHEQGRFLIHHKGDHTLMSWWDRTQGDTRGACNSSLVVTGTHDSLAMYDFLLQNFPRVAANLVAKGVALVEVNQ